MQAGSCNTLGTRVALIVAMAGLSACVKDNIVYRDRENFIQPPTAAANFVGYSDTTVKQTACGNCHIDQQGKWSQTAHAGAWKSLQTSGHAAASCEGCHAVSKLGNAATLDAVGYTSTKDARYHDVQCESCHGPGLTHVTSPGLTNRPLASVAADTGATMANGCGECHTGTHEPFVDQWKTSAHGGTPRSPAISNYVSGSNTTCVGCHTAQGALAAWGVNTAYVEKDQMTTKPVGITCVVCHDPHGGTGIDKQLRFSVTTADVTTNLCMKCHQRRAVPDVTSASGPHSPEGPTLLGYAGWFPPNMTSPDQGGAIIATHGSATNPKLCATCHVARFTVNDPATGGFVFQATGHGFNAIPCLDGAGKPTTADCADTQRTFKACTGSGCHGTEAAARSALSTGELRISDLVERLRVMLNDRTRVPSTEFSTTDGRYTTAEGSRFNLGLAATLTGTAPSVTTAVVKPGTIAHNPFLIEQLLINTMKQLQKDYGFPVASVSELEPMLSKTK
jgi:predicted CXXCH cytochrome family protein